MSELQVFKQQAYRRYDGESEAQLVNDYEGVFGDLPGTLQRIAGALDVPLADTQKVAQVVRLDAFEQQIPVAKLQALCERLRG